MIFQPGSKLNPEILQVLEERHNATPLGNLCPQLSGLLLPNVIIRKRKLVLEVEVIQRNYTNNIDSIKHTGC